MHDEHHGVDEVLYRDTGLRRDALRSDTWRPATVLSVEHAAEDMIALTLRPETTIPHIPGQYLDVRFPGERRSRSFSIASAPPAGESTDAEGSAIETLGPSLVGSAIELGIRVLPWGNLTPRLAAARPGTVVEIRGPVGRGFTWTPDEPGTLVLIGAGAGVTPLISMYEHAIRTSTPQGTRRRSGGTDPARSVIFLASARTPDHLYRYARYRDAMTTRFTAEEPRIDRAFLEEHLGPFPREPIQRRTIGRSRAATRTAPTQKDAAGVTVRVCGPGGFIGTMVDALLDLGVRSERIRSEGFT